MFFFDTLNGTYTIPDDWKIGGTEVFGRSLNLCTGTIGSTTGTAHTYKYISFPVGKNVTQYGFYASELSETTEYAGQPNTNAIKTITIPMKRTVNGVEQWLYSFDFKSYTSGAGSWNASTSSYMDIYVGPKSDAVLLHHWTNSSNYNASARKTDTGGYTSPYRFLENKTVLSNSAGYLTFEYKKSYRETKNGSDVMGRSTSSWEIPTVTYITMG